MSRIDQGNIGSFVNNKILEWKPISFAIEFIYQMRRNRHRLRNIPSTRQAIAIPKLLTAMYYRKSSLIPEDLITAAVITTPIEDQSIAREIAFNIIFSEDKKKKKEDSSTIQGTPSTAKIDKSKSDFMDGFLDVLDSELDIDSLDTEQMIDKAMEEFSGMMDAINQFYDKAGQNEEPYKSLIDIIEQRNNYKYLLEQGIKDVEQLKKDCHKTILREMNDLSPSDIKAATNLEWGKEILEQSNTPWINLAAQHLMDKSDFKQSLKKTMDNEEVGTSARALKYLNEVGMPKNEVAQLGNKLVDQIDNMMDVHELSNVMNYIPQFDHDKVLSKSTKDDIGTSFNISRSLDKKFHSNLTNELFEKWSSKNKSPSLSELFQTQADIPKWQKMLDKFTTKKISEYINNNGRAGYNLGDLSKQLMDLSNEAKFESCRKSFIENAFKTGMKALEASHDKEQFEQILKSLISKQIPLEQGQVIQMGMKHGIAEEEIIEMFGGNYNLLKTMYEQNIGDFKRYTKIMKKVNLSKTQMNELMPIALKKNNYQGLGALSHYHMGNAFGAAKKSGKMAQKSVAESLSAGSGENLLLQWFYHRNKVPRHIKDFVKGLCKDALIKIALNIISNQRGSGEKGLVPTTKLRTFIQGDDMDLINIDATIENIIMQGKSLNMITTEDLLVRRTEKGRVSICFLLDISGSMSGMKLAACSIAVMVLIGSLRADEVAICFFESNTHVVKEFGDERSLEDVADELLDLTARGGTRVQGALEWGSKELQKTQTERKICFLLTDCAFAEKKQVLRKELDEYLNQRVQFLLGVNTRSYSKKYAKWILEATQGEIIHILNIMDIPTLLTEVLERIG